MTASKSGSRKWFPRWFFRKTSGTGSTGGSQVVPAQFPPMGTDGLAPGGSRGSPPLIGELRNRSCGSRRSEGVVRQVVRRRVGPK